MAKRLMPLFLLLSFCNYIIIVTLFSISQYEPIRPPPALLNPYIVFLQLQTLNSFSSRTLSAVHYNHSVSQSILKLYSSSPLSIFFSSLFCRHPSTTLCVVVCNVLCSTSRQALRPSGGPWSFSVLLLRLQPFPGLTTGVSWPWYPIGCLDYL